MRRISSLAAGGIVISIVFGLATPVGVEAHETRSVADGHYQIVVGLIDEPVFAGDKSGLEFFVTDLSTTATPVAGEQAAEGAAVEGLEETLKAEVIFGDQTMELPLKARYNTPGA